MKLEPMRSVQSKLSIAFLAAAALVLGSCGGGGATSSPTSTGNLTLLPGAANFYATVPYTLNIAGGRKPYLVTSNEQTLLPLNFTTDQNQFTIVANNPGVVNVGLDPNEVPRRSVTIQVRDSAGALISNTYDVLQNFFTGYGVGYTSTCTPGASGAAAACSGTDTIITLIPVSNGVLYGNRELQLDRVRGDYSFVVENPNVTPQLVEQIRVRTDQVGRAQVRARVAVNAMTQMATYKLTDIATGVTTNMAFGIVQQAPVDAITFLPNNLITFTGRFTTQCGSGTHELFVYGGKPPYRVEPTNGLTVSSTTLPSVGSRLAITAPTGAPPCADGAVVITDSVGATGTVRVSRLPGSETMPSLAASPTAIASLACGTSSQITIVGGSGFYSSNSTHPRIVASIAGSTLTVSRLTGDTVTYPVSGVISITDGATAISVTITATPASCP